jgi:tetratricopeptide (TPR) repeat protein
MDPTIQSNVSRMIFFLFAIASTLTCQALADPYKPGDKVVVIQRAPIFFEGRADDVGFTGWIYEVLRVEGDRLWVASKTPGWIDRQYVIPLDRASAYFSSRIKLHPNDGDAVRARALMLMEEGKLDAAIDDFSAMIRNEPNVSMIWNDRGRAYMRKGDLDRAISEFNHAIEIDSQWPVYYTNRGIAWNRKGDYSKAILDWKAAIARRRNFHWPYQLLAQLYATCPDKQCRNGLEAINYATTACGLSVWKDPLDIEILAAAYAESGKFDVAATWQSQANEMYTNEADRKRGSDLLKAYKQQAVRRTDSSAGLRPAIQMNRSLVFHAPYFGRPTRSAGNSDTSFDCCSARRMLSLATRCDSELAKSFFS